MDDNYLLLNPIPHTFITGLWLSHDNRWNVDIIKEIVLDTATSNVYLLINDLQDWFSNKIVHSI